MPKGYLIAVVLLAAVILAISGIRIFMAEKVRELDDETDRVVRSGRNEAEEGSE